MTEEPGFVGSALGVVGWMRRNASVTTRAQGDPADAGVRQIATRANYGDGCLVIYCEDLDVIMRA
ncbi:MAG: hypothetical protein ABIX37_11540, partial [Gammaproteobacteria bacterium]